VPKCAHTICCSLRSRRRDVYWPCLWGKTRVFAQQYRRQPREQPGGPLLGGANNPVLFISV